MQTIAATTTRTGLRVRAELDTRDYATGVKISDAQMNALPLTRHGLHGDWNYAMRPEAYDAQVNTAPDPFDQPSPGLAVLPRELNPWSATLSPWSTSAGCPPRHWTGSSTTSTA